MLINTGVDQHGFVQCRPNYIGYLNAWMALCLLLLVSSSVEARKKHLEVGLELFDWREYDEKKRLLTETGPRVLVGFEYLSKTEVQNSFFSVTMRGYLGNVNYDGHLQNLDNGLLIPYSTNTHYWGVGIEPKYNLRFPVSMPDFVPSLSLGVGGDWWLRDLRGKYGYQERYSVGYTRFEIGVKSRQESGWFGRIGVKKPFLTREKITGLYLDGNACRDIDLVPSGNSTLSFTVGYRLLNRSTISLGYDGYSFSRSPDKRTYCGGQYSGKEVFQPRSEMALLSIRYSVPVY